MHYLETFRNTLKWANELGTDLARAKHLGYPLMIAALVTLAGGILLFLVDPSVRSPLDGVWSAWVTLTHVGFGDVVPTSLLGRLLAALLILFGLMLFSFFTASFSATLVERSRDARALETRRDADRLTSGEERILEELARLHRRLDALEARLQPPSTETRSQQLVEG